jgi:uncharacterized repeat protein (TIGR02543 family)
MKKLVNLVVVLLFSVMLTGCVDLNFDFGDFDNASYAISYESANPNVTMSNIVHSNPSEYNEQDEEINLIAPTQVVEGYSFIGWSPSSIPSGSTGDLAVIANFDVTEYSINYENTKNVTNTNPTTYNIEDNLITFDSLNDVTGYTFTGWTPSSIPTGSTGDTTVTANWVTSNTVTYQVDFDLQGGQTDIQTSYTVEENTRFPEQGILEDYIISKEGYTFDGWYTQPSGQGIKHSYIEQVTQNLTLFANWVSNEQETTLQVTLNASGGTGVETTLLAEPSTRVPENGSLPIPVKENYIFTGWYIHDNGTTQEVPIDHIENIDSNVNLQAGWMEITDDMPEEETQREFVVTFFAGGGIGYMDNQSFIENQSQAINNNLYKAPYSGLYFAGWSTQIDGSVEYYNEEVIEVNNNISLFAKWTTKSTHTITFDANMLDVEPKTQILVKNVPTQLQKNSFYPPHGQMEFAGWATQPNGEVMYLDEAEYTATEDATLYAIWNIEYLVTYNANGGLGEMLSQYFVSSTAKNLKENSFYAPHGQLYFNGWSTVPDGPVVYEDEELVTINEPTDLYANWAIEYTYTVNFDANGGEGEMTSQTFRGHSKQRLKDNTFYAPEGSYGQLFFAGWTTTVNPTTSEPVEYKDEELVYITENTTLYAIWKIINIKTISFNANGGSGSMTSQQGQYATVINLNLNQFTAPSGGYVFIGWATNPDGEPIYSNADDYYINSDATLYARWLKGYTVTFDSDGGEQMNAVNALEGFRAPSSGNFISSYKLGSYFGGWYTQPDGEGEQVFYIDAISNDITLYAYWVRVYQQGDERYVSFDSNGGSEVSRINLYRWDRAPESGYFEAPQRSGYIFDGWYTGKYAFGKRIDYVSAIDSNLKLYANWTPDTFVEVTFNSMGGSSIDSLTYDENERIPSTGDLPQPYRNGYEFTGWYKNYTLTDGPYTQVFILSDITLYAGWQPADSNIRIVSFESEGGINLDNIYANVNTRVPQNGNFTQSQKEGHIFLGWFTQPDGNGSKIDFIDNISLHTVLYANWTNLNKTVVFHSETGSPVSNVVVNYATRAPSVGLFERPTKSGDTFMGWYEQPGGQGERFTSIKSLTQNISLYADWEETTEDHIAVEENYLHNLQVEQNFNRFSPSGFINHQNATYNFKYGATNSNSTGCGWIATYNALRSLQIKGLYNKEIVISDIIRHFEYNGVIAGARLGTSPWAIRDYFRSLGYESEIYYRKTNFEQHSQGAAATIFGNLGFKWGHYRMIHEFEGKYQIYNTYDSSEYYYDVATAEGLNLYALITIK